MHPTLSAFQGPHIDGPVDTRPVSTGQDLLVYTTPPLEEDLEVVGPITAKLYAATSARDTDWMVRLVDVQPDGYAALLCDGIIRARCRDPERGGAFTSTKLSLIEPDKIYEYLIEFWRATGNAFLTGHRIRGEISSSYYTPCTCGTSTRAPITWGWRPRTWLPNRRSTMMPSGHRTSCCR